MSADRAAVHAELERVRAEFHHLLDGADAASLRRKSDGTKWTNEQLLFHMLFGYLVVRTLLPLVRRMSRAPRWLDRGFAGTLNATARPFDVVNYLGSCAGARVFDHRRMGAKLDRTIAVLHRRLDAETENALSRGMRLPPRWDPYFRPYMTLFEVYRYPTRHFDHHRAQLTLDEP